MAIVCDSKFQIQSVVAPSSIDSESYITFDPDEDLQTFCFVVDREKLQVYITMITFIGTIVNCTAPTYFGTAVKITNGEPIKDIQGQLFMSIVIKQLFSGIAYLVGENMHLENGTIIIPKFYEKMSSAVETIGVITTEEGDLDVYA